MTDQPNELPTQQIYNCKITCGTCRHTWPITTHIGDNLKTKCPECSREYELGDVAQTYFWSGGDRELREDDWPPIASTQTMLIVQDGHWLQYPSILFPMRFFKGGGK